MENQHRKITGYRELNEHEIDQMNRNKALAAKVHELIKELEAAEGDAAPDQRNLALAATNLQQGFMWLNRAIAKPTTFG